MSIHKKQHKTYQIKEGHEEKKTMDDNSSTEVGRDEKSSLPQYDYGTKKYLTC